MEETGSESAARRVSYPKWPLWVNHDPPSDTTFGGFAFTHEHVFSACERSRISRRGSVVERVAGLRPKEVSG